MRVGVNPNRNSLAEHFTPIVLTVITHLPNFTGYHSKRLEVVQTCLDTMRRHSGGDYTIIVWDNGSDEVFRSWVRNEYKPDVFIQSANVGKNLAQSTLANMLSPDKIISYCDDDMLFYPNWLQPQIELLKGFPNVSSVTGYPVRTQFRWGCDNTKKWGLECGKIQAGRFIPAQWENDFAVSIGRDAAWHTDYTKNDVDYLLEYNGLKAYATSHHCQFVSYAGTIAKAKKADFAAMGEERSFDVALDTLGLRLATTERLSRHMGNVIDDELRKAIV